MQQYYSFINDLFFVTSMIILVSSVDDFFIDVCYWARRLYRRIFIESRIKPLTLADLRGKPEQPIAIMVPAWKEHEVIANMLESNIKFVDYENYVFFVGVYQNDRATISEVDKVVARFPNVKKVVVPHNGPTCKADCLNWVIQAIFLYEKNTRKQFSIISMHDSEDVVHPLEFKLLNYLIPRFDFIQIPVMCLESRWYDFIRGIYIDEFAEYHGKDMLIRERLAGVVPSAGVATGFSRKAIMSLGERDKNNFFNTDSLTEDYDIAYRLSKDKSIKEIFVTFPVSVDTAKHIYHGAGDKKIPIAVSEYFPNTFKTAVRQRTRWNIGILFQAFGKFTWEGGFFRKYFFFHDRKGIITNLIVIPAYFLLINFLVFRVGQAYLGWPAYRPDVPVWLIAATTFFLANRLIQRIWFTTKVYNLKQGLLSIPRVIVSNLINMCTTVRATYIFARHLVTGKKIAWDKTTHEYPSLKILEAHYERLGDILVGKNKISQKNLADSLREQKSSKKSIGQILVEKGMITEDDLADALCAQTNYARGNISGASPEKATKLLDARLIGGMHVYPFAVSRDRDLKVFVTRALKDNERDAIIRQGYSSVEPYIILEKEMAELQRNLKKAKSGQNENKRK